MFLKKLSGINSLLGSQCYIVPEAFAVAKSNQLVLVNWMLIISKYFSDKICIPGEYNDIVSVALRFSIVVFEAFIVKSVAVDVEKVI